MVAVESTFRDKTPEVLDDAGLIARRIIQLGDRDADPGAMFLRHVLWRVHEEAGDGTATAAVLFEAIYTQGMRYIAAGGNAMHLRRALERGLAELVDELDRLTIAVAGREHLAQLAESICFDPALARLLGEIFDIVGEHGQVDVGTGPGRGLERQFVEGMHWSGGVMSPHMLADALRERSELLDAAILISDLELDDAHQLAALIETLQAGRGLAQPVRRLAIMAQKISDGCLGTLISASRDPEQFQVIAVRTPGLGTLEQAAAMQDLALLAGGRPLINAAGDTLRGFRAADLGHARRLWADKRRFGIVGGKGDPRELRRHIARLRAAFQASEQASQRAGLQERIGKLLGGSASLIIGGATENEIHAREKLARRTVALMRRALHGGVLPGGSVALLACRARLRSRLEAATTLDEQAAYRMLLQALEQPLRAIATNAGYDAAAVLGQVNRAPGGHGFDARSGQVVCMASAGLYDVADALKIALSTAVSGAATALTVDVLVHKRNPEAVPGQP
jgi:chaperonin GroEL